MKLLGTAFENPEPEYLAELRQEGSMQLETPDSRISR